MGSEKRDGQLIHDVLFTDLGEAEAKEFAAGLRLALDSDQHSAAKADPANFSRMVACCPSTQHAWIRARKGRAAQRRYEDEIPEVWWTMQAMRIRASDGHPLAADVAAVDGTPKRERLSIAPACSNRSSKGDYDIAEPQVPIDPDHPPGLDPWLARPPIKDASSSYASVSASRAATREWAVQVRATTRCRHQDNDAGPVRNGSFTSG